MGDRNTMSQNAANPALNLTTLSTDVAGAKFTRSPRVTAGSQTPSRRYKDRPPQSRIVFRFDPSPSLANYIFIKKFFYLYGLLYCKFKRRSCFFITYHQFLLNDLTGMFYAIFTNMPFLAGDKYFYFIAAAATK